MSLSYKYAVVVSSLLLLISGAAYARGGGGHGAGVQIPQRNGGTGGEHTLGNGASYAACAAGDDCGAALEVELVHGWEGRPGCAEASSMERLNACLMALASLASRVA